jgi:hypothetical protein
MQATKQELESENEHLRTQLEMAHKIISEALGYDGDDAADDDDAEEDLSDEEEDE